MAGRKDSVDGVKGIGDEDERAIETLDPRPTGRPKSNSCGDVGEGGGIECRRPVGRETSSERPRSVRSSSGEPRRFCSLRVRRTWSRRSSAVRVLVEANSLCAGEGGAGARLAKGTCEGVGRRGEGVWMLGGAEGRRRGRMEEEVESRRRWRAGVERLDEEMEERETGRARRGRSRGGGRRSSTLCERLS